MADDKVPHGYIFAAGDKYDRQTGVGSRLVAPGFIEFMQIQDGDSVLDVGCGTGILSLALAEKTKASRIAGIDQSKSFVDYARTKSADPRLFFETGDAQSLPYEDNSFDRAMAMLVIQFIPDKLRAISEMKRVTKPGGCIGAALWDPGMSPNQPMWDSAKNLGIPADIPSHGGLASNSAAGLTKLLSEAGLETVSAVNIVIERRFSSFDEYWTPLSAGEGVPGRFLGSLSREQKSAVKEQIRRTLLGESAEGPISINAKVWIARGTVPCSSRRVVPSP